MKLITISGVQGCGKSTRAAVLYNQHVAQGLSVAMIDTDSYGDRYSDERAHTRPDVKIVTRIDHRELRERTRFVP